MSILPASTDYTDRDFDSLRLRLQSLIRSTFPQWTDFDVSNFGNVLIEMFAFVGDVTAHYTDRALRESRVGTATQRKSMIALAKMFGYRIDGASAATANVTVTLPTSAIATVTIPAGQEVRTPEVVDPVRFQLLTAAVITAGQSSATVVAENSRSRSQVVSASLLAGQDVPLDYSPYLDDSASVTASNGAYSEVDSFLASGPVDRHFVVLVDDRDRATVRFGDGVRGALPTGTVTIAYKTGGGTIGNVEAGRIVVLDGTFSDAEGRTVRPTVINAARASGGADRETVEQIRLAMPESLRVGDRCVTREDFEITAREVPGVVRALMTTSNEDAAVAENAGILYVVPTGGGVPTQTLLDAVETAVTVTRPHTLTFSVDVLPPSYRTVNVWGRVTFQAGQVPATVKAAIVAALQAFFSATLADGTPNPAIDFGLNLSDQLLAWSDVFNAVRDVAGVRRLNAGDLQLNGVAADVNLLARDFPALGTVTIVDAATGLEV